MSFPSYPAYRNSGSDWLKKVPHHWIVTAIKRMAINITDGAHISPETENGVYPFVSTRDVGIESIDFEGCLRTSAPTYEYMVRTGCRPHVGDVLFSKDGTIGRTIVVEDELEFVVASSLIIIRPNTARLEPRFLHYLCQSSAIIAQVDSFVRGAGLPRLSIANLLRVIGCFPPLEEQRAITTFLDCETAKIDALVAEQERLIELLKEKRRTVISHAVTKGLNPDAAMKESGVPWMGKIPAHWEILQSRRMFRVRSEPAYPSDQQLTASQKHGVILQSAFVEAEGRRVVEVIKLKDQLLHVEPNDFIISMRSFQGGIEWCGLRGSTSYHYVILTPVAFVHPPFFAQLFKSDVYIQALRATTDLIRDGQELRWSHFVQVPLPRVPLDEQQAIAAFLNNQFAKIDPLIAEAERAVSLLEERRTALISAAVTGQIDVRAVVERFAAA